MAVLWDLKLWLTNESFWLNLGQRSPKHSVECGSNLAAQHLLPTLRSSRRRVCDCLQHFFDLGWWNMQQSVKQAKRKENIRCLLWSRNISTIKMAFLWRKWCFPDDTVLYAVSSQVGSHWLCTGTSLYTDGLEMKWQGHLCLPQAGFY